MQLNHPSCSYARQSGSTLIISLIILVLIMILGITAMTTSDTQFKLAGNLQFENGAMNNAETAMTTAESWLSTGTNYKVAGLISDACASRSVPALYPLNTTTTPSTRCFTGDPLSITWDNTNSVEVATNQRYMIELLSINQRLLGSGAATGTRTSVGCNQVNTYLITARGQSLRGATKFVQSYYSVLSC